jgi:DNA (cytosine-5)-methyltransferase 1
MVLDTADAPVGNSVVESPWQANIRSVTRPSSQPVCIDLFCGAGGLSEGLRQAGFSTAFAADFDEQAIGTYSHNHSDVHAEAVHVENLSGEAILQAGGLKPGQVDLLAGGPPCQGFSLAGPRLPDDPKNRMYLEFVRIAKELRPRVLLMENVQGIQSMQGGLVTRALHASVEELGYSVVSGVLNAAHFGVPQSRPRFIMIAVLNGDPSLPPPTHSMGSASEQTLFDCFPATPTVAEALSDLPVLEQGEGAEELSHSGCYENHFQKERQGFRNPGMIYNHRATGHSERIVQRYAMIPQGQTNAVVPAELRTKKVNVYRLREDAPSRTVTCNFRTDLLHPWMPRGLTVREAARLQSFDDDYCFFGNLTRKARWVTQDDQVGNAVPPLMAHALGTHIRTLLGA